MNKIIILLLGIFFISFTSATLTYQIDTEANLTVVCLNDGYCESGAYCNINVENPDADFIIQNKNMTDYGTWFGYNITPKGYGIYLVSGYCYDGGDYEKIDYSFMATMSGEERSIEDLYTNILLLLSVIAIMSFIVSKRGKTDFKSVEENIVREHNHVGETMVRGILTGLFKNTFIWIYFIGWILVLILRQILFEFGSVTVYGYFELMANVYSLGLLLVTVYMIGYLLGYMRDIFSILADNAWGVEN